MMPYRAERLKEDGLQLSRLTTTVVGTGGFRLRVESTEDGPATDFYFSTKIELYELMQAYLEALNEDESKDE